jgi:hypothetical protein
MHGWTVFWFNLAFCSRRDACRSGCLGNNTGPRIRFRLDAPEDNQPCPSPRSPAPSAAMCGRSSAAATGSWRRCTRMTGPRGYPCPVETVRMERGRTLPARLSANPANPTRWCLCCDTVLPPTGHSLLCLRHRAEHRSVERRRRQMRRATLVPIEKSALVRAHQQVDRLVSDLGSLHVAY